jgi:hypothetical protein
MNRQGDLDVLALGAGREQFDHAFRDMLQIEAFGYEFGLAGLDLGEVEDFIDQ